MLVKRHIISKYQITNQHSAERDMIHKVFSDFDYFQYVIRSDNDLTQNDRR